MDNILLVIGVLIAISTHILHPSNGLPVLRKNKALQNPFVGFFILPHGGITLDPQNLEYSTQPAFNSNDSKEKAIRLNLAMQEASDALIASKPDLIIFSTPHGLQLDYSSLLVVAESAYGIAGPDIWENFTASFDIDAGLSTALYATLRKAKDPVERLRLGTVEVQMPLLWAEVIPWYFIRQAAAKANYKLPKAIYIGHASGVSMDAVESIGRDIAKAAILRKEFAGKRIAVVVSGDMSHYHSNDTKSPYPYSPYSIEFDKYLVNWGKLDRNAETESESSNELLINAGKIQHLAGHCGFKGFVMLHGIMEELVNQNWNYKSKFYAYETPSYFGMMVASWIPE